MKASEIFRKLADIIDSNEGGDFTQSLEPAPVLSGDTTADIEHDAQVNTTTMVPPLQQKLDIMKKMAGIDDVETCGPDCECEKCRGVAEIPMSQPPEDVMASIMRNAGLSPMVVTLADEDEPFEG